MKTKMTKQELYSSLLGKIYAIYQEIDDVLDGEVEIENLTEQERYILSLIPKWIENKTEAELDILFLGDVANTLDKTDKSVIVMSDGL